MLSLLDACRLVGLAPITSMSLHVAAYLCEIFAPASSRTPMDGKVLKERGTPYYPALQQDVDRLIGMGLVRIDGMQEKCIGDGLSVLLPSLRLESGRAEPLLEALRSLPDEEETYDFLFEVIQAFSRLSDEQIPYSMAEDATYGNPSVDKGEVIDLGEWVNPEATPTSHVAAQIRGLASETMNFAEIMDIYVNHIAYRLDHGHR